MIDVPDALLEPLKQARRYAALSGAFEPVRALPSDLKHPEDIAVVASLLAAACDTNPSGGQDRWLMRVPERHHELRLLAEASSLEAAVVGRRTLGTDPVTDDLHAALLDRSPMSRDDIERALEVGGPRGLLERMVVVLDWAGAAAAARNLLPAVRSAIAVLDQRDRSEQSAARGFVGRLSERSQVADWLKDPMREPPVTCLLIQGAPSIGKSSMLAEAVFAFEQGRAPLLLRFDFDWAGLDIQDQLGFTMEAARQLAQQLGKDSPELLDARLAAAAVTGGSQPSAFRKTQFPAELARQMADTVARSGRSLLVVLDTLEVLRGRGETHPIRLFDWLDSVVGAGLYPLRVIAASRGNALDVCPDRVGHHLVLEGLGDDDARQLLLRLGVRPADHRGLIELSGGNPLRLRLGAEIAAGGEASALLRRRRKKAIQTAVLYRFLLSRVNDNDIKKVVNPGLIVRRLNTELLHDVVAPQLGLTITRDRAETLMQALQSLDWLVERDPGAPGFITHRPDMRRLLLPLLYGAAPKRCAAINAAAAQWFGARGEPWCETEALYHRLQLLRTRPSPPEIGWAAATRMSQEMIEELPPAARDLVHAVRGERSDQFRRQTSFQSKEDDPKLGSELLAVLQRRDWREGKHMVDLALASGTLAPASPAADAVGAFLWRTGQWHRAHQLLRARDRILPQDDDLPNLPPPVALARLEMRAELNPQKFLGGDKATLVSGLYSAAIASSDDVARHGAIAFLLSDRSRLLGPSMKEIDPLGAARGLWARDGDRADLVKALQIAQERSSAAWAMDDAFREAPKAQRLGSLTPYAVVAGNLVATTGRSPLLDHCRAVLHGLAAGDQAAADIDPITRITGLGLFAEWAGAAAFVSRDPDLRLIGLAAERWRRTMAGHWSYGRAPSDWVRQNPDTTTGHRLARLLSQSDPVAAAIRDLALWSAGNGAAFLEQLEHRWRATLAGAPRAGRTGAYDITRHLVMSDVPSAFIAPLTTIIVTRHATTDRWVRAADKPTGASAHKRQREVDMKDFSEDREARLNNLRGRITPELRERIWKAVNAGTLPRPILAALSRSALSTLAADKAPLESALPIAALEGIVQRFGRPPLLVRNDKVELEELTDFPADTGAKIKGVERFVPSVGRIEFVNFDMSWGGTGWVIDQSKGKWLVVTNRHVAKLVARRRQDGSGSFNRNASGAPYGAKIDFGEEVDSPLNNNNRTAPIGAIEYLADDLSADVALLRIGNAPFPIPSPLDLEERLAVEGELVALVGYPAHDPRYDADDQARYFRDLYEVKRFAPGKIMQNAGDAAMMTHDCTSLGGNSGSPVISLENGRVLGLHFTGRFGKGNGAVGAATLRKLLNGERPVFVSIRSQIEEKPDRHHDAKFFEGRKGFDTKSLKDGQVATPWPGLPERFARGLASPSDQPVEPNELRYMHFGVKYSGEYKLPLLTAVNIDGERAVRIKRGDDQWFSDGRIPRDIQLGAQNYANDRIDRGHMVRREDPNWAPAGSPNDASVANFDTFHYVNAAPQHSELNQGKTLWQGLENYILDSVRTHGLRACVFTGPVLRDDKEDETTIDGAIVPAEFWKVVATLDEADQRLHATAYLLSQGQLIRKLNEERGRRESLEGFTLGGYRTFQLSIADLEAATGYDFAAYRDADPLNRHEAAKEARASGEPVFMPLDSLADIRL